MNKIVINAAVADWIELVMFRQRFIDNPTPWDITTDYDVTGKSLSEVLEMVGSGDGVFTEDGCLSVTRKATRQDVDKELNHSIGNQNWALSKIRAYCNTSQENLDQVMAYLQHKGITLPQL